MKIIVALLLSIWAHAEFAETTQTPKQQYQNARKQFILEYTVFGVDECLQENSNTLIVDEKDRQRGKILVGSTQYFSMLSQCFARLKNLCPGEKCVVSKSMGKRVENVKHVDYLLSKINRTSSNNSRAQLHQQTLEEVKSQQIARMQDFRKQRSIASNGEIAPEYVVNTNLPETIITEDEVANNPISEEEIIITTNEHAPAQTKRELTEYDKKENVRKIASLNIFKIEDDQEMEVKIPINLFE